MNYMLYEFIMYQTLINFNSKKEESSLKILISHSISI